MSKKMTYQANTLIEAGNNLSVLESTIYYLGLSRLLPQLPHTEDREEAYQTKFEPILITYTELALSTNTHALSKKGANILCDKIMSKNFITIKKSETLFEKAVIFRKLKYEEKVGLTLIFNEDLIPYLLDLKDRAYTPILLDEMVSLSSTYSRKILELVLQYRKLRKRTIQIVDLRYYLGVKDDEYTRMEAFIRVCVDKPCKEITLHTSYDVTYEKVKTGRSITAIEFHFQDNEKQEQELESNIRQADERAKERKSSSGFIQMMTSPTISAQEWRIKHGYRREPFTKNEAEAKEKEMKSNEQQDETEEEIF